MNSDRPQNTPLSFRLRPLALGVVLVLLVLAVFGRVVSHAWLEYDDRFHVIENPHFAPLDRGSFGYFWQEEYGNLYIPVAYNTFAAEVWLTQSVTKNRNMETLSPVLFQGLKPFLHGGAVLLVFAVLRRLGAHLFAAAIGAAVFAVHPLQSEAVAWISETRGLLCGVFSLSAMWLHLRAGAASTGIAGARRWQTLAMHGGATLVFAMALLAKPAALSLPMVVVVIDLLILRRPWRWTLAAIVPWCLLAGAMLVVTRSLQSGEGVRDPAPLWAGPLIAGDTLAFYLGKLVLPFNLTPDYGRTPGRVLAGSWVYVAWLVPTVLLTVACIVAGRHRRLVIGAAGVWIAALVPVLGLVPFDHQNISTVADRYVYLAMLGPALLIGLLLSNADRRGWAVAACLVVALLAIRSWDQVGHWRDDLSLWSHSAAVSKGATTQNNLGNALTKAGRHDEAITHFRLALEIEPALAIAKTNIAWAQMDLGQLDLAEEAFEEALGASPLDPRAHTGRGLLMTKLSRPQDAATCFARAAELRPADAEAHCNLGLALAESGDASGALEQYQIAVRLRPRYAVAWHNMAVLLDDTGRTNDAVDCWQRAVEIEPALAPAWYRLANALAKVGSLDQAIAAYQRTLEMNPAHADAANNLGLVFIRQNKVEDAIAAFREAVRADPQHPEANDNLRNAQLLAGSRIGK